MTLRYSTVLKVAVFLLATVAATGALVAAGLAERAPDPISSSQSESP
jgi:hypothetical protein